jgi:hypothetical protein
MREIVEMTYLFEKPLILDDAKLHAVLPHVHKTSFEDGVRATIAAGQALSHV